MARAMKNLRKPVFLNLSNTFCGKGSRVENRQDESCFELAPKVGKYIQFIMSCLV